MAVKIISAPERLVPMERNETGYWTAMLENLPAGTRYLYRLDNDRDRPDSQSEETFRLSKIDWSKRDRGHPHVLLGSYGQLIRLRREMAALSGLDRGRCEVSVIPEANVITMRRWDGSNASHACCLFNFEKNDINIVVSMPAGQWNKVLDSSDSTWNGPSSLLPERIRNNDRVTMRGQSVVLYLREGN